MRWTRLLCIGALLLEPAAALAQGLPRRAADHVHRRWSAESNAPGPIFIMAQARDGWLWMTAGDGLFRFDGFSFEEIPITPKVEFQGSPTALLATRSGDIWVHFSGSGKFGRYRDGTLRLMPSPALHSGEQVVQMVEMSDGAIWALPDRGLVRYAQDKWQRFGEADGLPDDFTQSLLVARDGALWVSFEDSVVRLAPGARRFETVRATPDANGRLSQDPAGRVWLSGKQGSFAISGPGGRGTAPPVRFPWRTDRAGIVGRPMFDRAGNLWIPQQFGGVLRLTQPSPEGARSAAEAAAAVETLRKSDGLTSDITMNAFEDRETNIWITTEIGLDKFRPATIRTVPGVNSPPNLGDVLLGASDGSVYIAEATTVYRVLPGAMPEPILTGMPDPEAMCEAPDGAIWMAFKGRMLAWRAGIVRPIPGKPETANGFVSCAFDRHGDFWVTAGDNGMFRYRQGRWQPMFGPTDQHAYWPTVMVRDTAGRLFLRWSPRAMRWIDFPRSTTLSQPAGSKPISMRGLYATPRGDVLSGSTLGFSRYRDGTVRTLTREQAPYLDAAEGIAESADGHVWTAEQEVIARTRTGDLDRAFADPTFRPPSLQLGPADGLTNRVYAGSASSMVQGAEGRLWIATIAGPAWLDPKDIVRNPVAPPVAIASLKVGDTRYRDPHTLTLPAAPPTIEIAYAALSFADPKRVQVRYKLEGYDADWIDPGARRQAFYTNLAPGTYRFRVIAANNEGVWNRAGATLDFEIPPTFVQSRWFLALCLAIGLFALWLAYRLRVAHVTGRIRARLEARLSERERIARELHDTLLQSVQGLILRFQAVADRLSPGEASRAQLEAALTRADDVIVEGRNRVHDLRVADRSADLPALLADLAGTSGFDPATTVRVAIEGTPRPTHPMVAAEIERIAREALHNVANHAQARTVTASLAFGPRHLVLAIEDDGVGIPAEVLEQGRRPGHFGLVGIGERAARIGAELAIESRPREGTRILLSLPARLAYADARRTGWRRFLPAISLSSPPDRR